MSSTTFITSGKGGVGKSTVCAGLATALALRGQRVLLIELSPRSLDVLLGVSHRTMLDVSDVLDERCTIEEAAISAGSTGKLKLLCAPIPYFSQLIKPAVFQALIAQAQAQADIILVDAPGVPHMAGPLAPLCDSTVLVCTPDPVSCRDARAVSDMIFESGVKNPRLCINQLPANFARIRPVAHLDYVIDTVCAQLISVLPRARNASFAAPEDGDFNFPRGLFRPFDNFAQRIMGKYIDLWIQ